MSLTELVDFFQEVNALKRTKRYSTCSDSVRDSSADHSWRLALMTIDVADKLKLTVDVPYATKLAICHDICEYRDENDIDSFDVARGLVSKDDKRKAEQEVMEYLASQFNRPEIYRMWLDFEESTSQEAKYVKALDKIEAQLHLIESNGLNHQGGGEHSVLYADKAVLAFPQVLPLLKEVKKRLKAVFEAEGLKWKPEYDRV